MRSKISNLIILIVLTIFSPICLADKVEFSNDLFTISLPNTMHVSSKNEDQSIGLYQYVFLSNKNTNNFQYQLRLIILDKLHKSEDSIEQFELESLGAMIAIFTDAYHLPLENQKEALSKKPEIIELNSHVFKYVHLNWEKTHAKFFIHVSNDRVYMFTLSSTSDEKIAQIENMDLLENLLTSVKFK